MSILIKGLEMPVFEHQSLDIRKGADGKWYMVDTNAETSDGAWHEIVPIPPHGRLIDADLIMKKLKESCRTVFGDDGDIPECSGLSIVSDYIESAPTVIPASEKAET